MSFNLKSLAGTMPINALQQKIQELLGPNFSLDSVFTDTNTAYALWCLARVGSYFIISLSTHDPRLGIRHMIFQAVFLELMVFSVDVFLSFTICGFAWQFFAGFIANFLLSLKIRRESTNEAEAAAARGENTGRLTGDQNIMFLMMRYHQATACLFIVYCAVFWCFAFASQQPENCIWNVNRKGLRVSLFRSCNFLGSNTFLGTLNR